MSAICGYWSLRSSWDPREVVSRVMSAQYRLGPDRQSTYHSPALSVGYQTLKITHEDGFESQPLVVRGGPGSSAGGSSLLVADARIFNRAELALQFTLSGAEAAAMPDSAFVLLAWERWGRDCVDHLIGAFAFAAWDAQAEEFFLACDHAGERPLYFCRTPDAFAFATTARALLACPGIGAEMDEETVARDLIGLPPAYPRTRYRDIRQIGPGHSLSVGRETIEPTPRRYWIYDKLPETRFARDEDYVDAFLEIFEDAVRCRLHTAAGIGSELSAGLDSAAVTATAARLMAAEGRRLTAYTSVPRAGFSGLGRPDCIADEGPFAAEVAALYPNIDHLLVDSTGSDMVREMERAFGLLERPLGAPINQIWIDLIRDRAAEAGINVMLTGAQGNATISYSGSGIIGQSFRSGHWLAALRHAYVLRRDGISSGREALSQTFFSLLPWSLRSRLDPSIRSYGLEHVAMRPECDRELQLFDLVSRHAFVSRTGMPPIMETLFHGKGTGDYMSMSLAGWGIEQRDPTADKRVFEYCASIPMEQYMVGKPGRSLIRRAMRGRLPDATLDRRRRGVQGADWYESLTPIRGQLAEEVTRLEASPGARWLLDLDRVRRAVEQWPATAHKAAEQGYLYSMIVPDAIAVGYFIRRTEEMRDTHTAAADGDAD
jgi:asparagine synthase (glutamine-hydrolysing)